MTVRFAMTTRSVARVREVITQKNLEGWIPLSFQRMAINMEMPPITTTFAVNKACGP